MSFACKQALMRLIHKHWHGMGSSSPQCNTPTGEGVGGDDFDGEDDDADRADRTTPEEASGTDAEGPPAGEQPDVQATEVHNCFAEVNSRFALLISLLVILVGLDPMLSVMMTLSSI